MLRAIVGLLLCAGCHSTPDTRTAVELEQEARHRRSEAELARANVNVQQTTQPMPGAYEREITQGPIPQYGGQQGTVAYQEKTASELEDAAGKIRRDAEMACQRVRASERRSCPIGKVAKVTPIPRGARLEAESPPAAEGWRDQVGCAVAQSRVDRPAGADQCPLLIPGADSRVVDTPAGPYIEITVTDEARAAEVRRRAQALVGK
jgi:hypothetical protein